jgi:hypothetical protein
MGQKERKEQEIRWKNGQEEMKEAKKGGENNGQREDIRKQNCNKNCNANNICSKNITSLELQSKTYISH